jgi:hypothetical protein
LDIRCFETRVARLIAGPEVKSDEEKIEGARVAPIASLRNRPNGAGIIFKYGKKAGTPKPWKHKDCNDIA